MEGRSTEDQEMIREFLVESEENLSRLDQDLVELEKHPQDKDLLSSIFRTIHTIKGACGFLAFSTLESITHQAESLLSQLRDGKRPLTQELVSLILETVDATRKVLSAIEQTGQEGTSHFEELTARLRAAAILRAEEAPVAVTPEPAIEAARVVAAVSDPEPEPAPVADAAAPAEVVEAAPKELVAEIVADAKDRRTGEERRRSEGRRQDDSGKREDEGERHSAAVDSNIRVGVGLLDKLMDLVGELVLTRNQILQFNSEREDAGLNATSQRLNLITTELQEGVMKTRMQPIGVVWNKFPRMVRDMAFSLGKQIVLEMEGAETELDRTIIEAIKDPLMHLIRNSCDHGIERPEVRLGNGKVAPGTISLRAFHEGGQVNIEIGDDGAGIDVERVKQKAIEKGLLRAESADKLTDREAVNLIFMPGFSTAQAVTNISGRGVGMDVVKSHIEKIGGVVDLFSRPGEGSTTKIRIPLTLAIIPGLVVSSGGERFVIPQASLLELIRIEADAIGNHVEYVHGTPVYRRRGSLLPLVYLNEVLRLRTLLKGEASNIVVLQAEDRQFGLVVDSINDTQEIVVKPLGKQLKGLTLYAGATIMGDGRVALILDVLGIGHLSGVFDEKREQARTQEKQKALVHSDVQRLLLMRSGSFERLAIPLSLVARLEEFSRSAIERASGGLVIQYRDGLLPLISLRSVLEGDPVNIDQVEDPVQVVVFNDGDRSIGMIVDQIVDVVEDMPRARKQSRRNGILGSAVVGKKVTDFLDLNSVIKASDGNWEQSSGVQSIGKTVLVADSSAFSRSMTHAGLEMAGFDVVSASNATEANHCMEQQNFDLIVLADEFQPDGSSEYLSSVRKNREWRDTPVLGLLDSEAAECWSSDCQGWAPKANQQAVVATASQIVMRQNVEAEEMACAGEEK